MTLRHLISLSLALFVWQTADAQLAPSDDFFNGGAQFYISNNIPAALERTESGLKIYPDDVKLKKLEQLLKQKQQQQQQQQKEQQSQQQKSKDQQQQNTSKSQKESQDQQKNDEQNNHQTDQKKKNQQNQPEQQPSTADKQKAEQQEKKEGEGQPLKPGQMTPEEAKRLLDAQKGNEQILQLKPKDKSEQSRRPVKDW